MNDDRRHICRAFAVPPHFVGVPPEAETREDRARILIENAKAFDMDPLDIDDADVAEIELTERLWRACVITSDEAVARLRPLRERRAASRTAHDTAHGGPNAR